MLETELSLQAEERDKLKEEKSQLARTYKDLSIKLEVRATVLCCGAAELMGMRAGRDDRSHSNAGGQRQARPTGERVSANDCDRVCAVVSREKVPRRGQGEWCAYVWCARVCDAYGRSTGRSRRSRSACSQRKCASSRRSAIQCDVMI
jgi:hypothetical protein